ncbi:zona pellucida sperm-binding protein 4-like [Carcharodon carcharias]|uniref:zona pellucida sperm-binding protein 4-like n=1 Tax=Carcharodon carcharias TaxID=13397 RepID=UPI001B7EE163|nr:zona pellucida sperm-binding protein 4-like [Carcharodon carcharias]
MGCCFDAGSRDVPPCFYSLDNLPDAAYRSWYVATDYPIVSVLRESVFVEVRVLKRNDPTLVLVLNDCWATPSPEPYSGLRWDLLVNRSTSTAGLRCVTLPSERTAQLPAAPRHEEVLMISLEPW